MTTSRSVFSCWMVLAGGAWVREFCKSIRSSNPLLARGFFCNKGTCYDRTKGHHQETSNEEEGVGGLAKESSADSIRHTRPICGGVFAWFSQRADVGLPQY